MVAGGSFLTLVAVVLLLGASAIAAELLDTWEWYFLLLERPVAVTAPVAVVLAAVSLGAGVVFVLAGED
jgi:hypothetical protein